MDFKRKFFVALVGGLLASPVLALNCNIISQEDIGGWNPQFTFQCDEEVDLSEKPVTFELTNGVKLLEAWGMPNSEILSDSNPIEITFNKTLPANTPGTVSLSVSGLNSNIESFSVGNSQQTPQYQANIVLNLSATPNQPSKALAYKVMDDMGNEVSVGHAGFATPVSIIVPVTPDQDNTFTVEFTDLVEGGWVYGAEPVNVNLSADQSVTKNVIVKGEVLPLKTFSINVSGMKAFTDSAQLSFVHVDSGYRITFNLEQDGSIVAQLPENTGEWSVVLPRSNQYRAISNMSSIDTNASVPTLQIDFQVLESSHNRLENILDDIALEQGFSNSREFYQYLFAHHLSEAVLKNPHAYGDFKVAKEVNSGAAEYFKYDNMIKAYERLINHELSSEFMSTFLANENDYDNMREIAAFFANVGQETNGGVVLQSGFFKTVEKPASGIFYAMSAVSEGQCHLDAQRGQPNSGCNYDHGNKKDLLIRPYPGAQYYGRGPKQLSYPENYYNYGHYTFDENGHYLDENGQVAIYVNPDILVEDPVRGWQSAFAFMVKQDDSVTTFKKPSMTQSLHKDTLEAVIGNETKYGSPGFGHAINVINGGIECKTDEVLYQQLNRINNYLELLIRFGVPIDRVTVKMSDGSYYNPSELTQQALIDRVYPSSWSLTNWGSYIIHTQPLPVELYNFNTIVTKLVTDDKGNTTEVVVLDSNNKPVRDYSKKHITEIILYYGDETGLGEEVLSCGAGFQPYGS